MLLFIAAALIIARLRGCRITPLFREWSLLPLWLTELTFWVFQCAAWRGDYRFIPYAGLLQKAGILALLWPVLKFRLTAQALLGAGLTVLGTFLNGWVMRVNGGRMPVCPTLSEKTGYYRSGALAASQDVRHILMSAQTKLNFLADWIDVGFSILSPGDVLIHTFTAIIVYAAAVQLNKESRKTKPCNGC